MWAPFSKAEVGLELELKTQGFVVLLLKKPEALTVRRSALEGADFSADGPGQVLYLSTLFIDTTQS